MLVAYQTEPLMFWNTGIILMGVSADKNLPAQAGYSESDESSIFSFVPAQNKFEDHKITLTAWRIHFVSYSKVLQLQNIKMHWTVKGFCSWRLSSDDGL